MRTLEVHSKQSICEVCGESADNPTIIGVESERNLTRLIRLCHNCGPIDLDIMQLCREMTIRCSDN